jgi:hypothetical protein
MSYLWGKILKKFYSLLIGFIILVSIFSITNVFAQVSIGFNEGDWVEYTTTYTGNPPDSYPVDSRMEIITIQGTQITVEINNILLNGTQTSRTETFDIETDAPDFIIIPANLGPGDEIRNEELGTYTIERIENYDFKGTTRELVYANVLNVDFKWDRTTGIVIEFIQTTDTFTRTLRGDDTNIIQAQALDSMLLYGIIITIIVVIIIVIVLLLKKKK